MSKIQEKLASNDFLKIVCVGDMQTSQPYSKPSWSDWLQRTLWENGDARTSWRRKLVNTAVDRATPRHVSTYYREFVSSYKPDAIILSFGISPMFPNFEEKQFTQDMETLLNLIEKEGVTPVLWSPYPLLTGESREVTLMIGALFRQLSVARDIQFVDIYNEFTELELTKVMTYIVGVKNDLFLLEQGKPDIVSLNDIGSFVVAKKMSADIFNIGIPQTNAGDFTVPAMELARKW